MNRQQLLFKLILGKKNRFFFCFFFYNYSAEVFIYNLIENDFVLKCKTQEKKKTNEPTNNILN